MFREAYRRIADRKNFAPRCKIDLLTPSLEKFEDSSVGLLAVPFFPKYSRHNDEIYLPTAGFIDGGGWTNGFILTRDVINWSVSYSHYFFKEKAKLFICGRKIKFACIVYFYKAQDEPVVAFCGQNKSMLFRLNIVDDLFSRLCRKFDRFELYFDIGLYGMVIKTVCEPVAFLAKLKFPVIIESALIAHAERYYAICRN